MKIYDEIAQYIQGGLNTKAADSPLTFHLRTDHNYIEPVKRDALTIQGILSFTPQDIMPIQGLDLMTVSCSVDFVCPKELVDEAMALCLAFVQEGRGEVFPLGEYAALATYTTPERGGVDMVGEIGEAQSITFFPTIQLIKNGYMANNASIAIDGQAVYATSWEIGKTRTVPTDNQANSETLKGNAQTQAIAISLSFIATKTNTMNALMSEIMSLEMLNETHNITFTGLTNSAQTFKTVLTTGAISGQAGGLVYITAAFTISR